jgi:hydroxymethylpyrimidine/phosphomethylpyrimidine kinase
VTGSRTPPRILIVAGSDSGGGAGIQTDIKTVTMLGGHAMTAITALTAQNTLGVSAVHPVPADFVVAQMDAVLSDIGADAVKIGMIGSAETADAVADRLEALAIPIVFDPVMVATSGAVLADEGTIAAFARLMRLAAVTTPNLPELAALGGEEAVLAHGCHLLAKGGHGEGSEVVDRLIAPGGAVTEYGGTRIETRSTHGTGCTLASAIACLLGAGRPIEEAVEQARLFVRLALREAPGIGGGHGPLGQQRVRLDLPLSGMLMPNQLTLPASDYQASLSFYSLLGARPIVQAPPRYARFETDGGMTLSIEVADPAAPPSTAELFFQCADVDREVARLEAQGIVFNGGAEDRSYGWRVADTRDPHGNPVRLYSPGEARRFPPWRLA